MGKTFSQFKEQILLAVILLLAAWLRLFDISGHLTFLGDEGRDVLVAYNILHGHLTLLGPRASAGDFFTGPIYYYMMAPFLWLFNYSPVGPAVMIAVLSVATVWLIYYLGKKFITTSGAFIAAFLYAVSPLVITYSHSSWNPNPMPFFTLLVLYFLYLGVKTSSAKYFFVSGILYGICLQLHYIEVITGLIIGFFIFLSALSKTRFLKHLINRHQQLAKITEIPLKLAFVTVARQYGLIFIGFLVGFSPFIAFELRHQFENSKAILKFVLADSSTGYDVNHNPFWQTIGDVFFRLFAHSEIKIIAASQILSKTD